MTLLGHLLSNAIVHLFITEELFKIKTSRPDLPR